MTGDHFKDRERKALGYLGGIYILDWTAKDAPANNLQDTRNIKLLDPRNIKVNYTRRIEV